MAQGAGLAIDVSAAQLANTTFQSGSGTDQLWVRAFDGQDWGDWKGFTVAAPIDHAPVVTASNVSLSAGQTVAASSLFSVSDADVSDQVVKYQFWDGTAGSSTGHFAINGTEQAVGSAITVLAADLAHASFVAGTSANDQLWVRASDGAVLERLDRVPCDFKRACLIRREVLRYCKYLDNFRRCYVRPAIWRAWR